MTGHTVEMAWPLTDVIALVHNQIRSDAAGQLLEYAHQQQYAITGHLDLSIRGNPLILRAAAKPYRPALRIVRPTTSTGGPRPACQGHPEPDLWFSPDPAETAEAQRICREECAIREECLAGAITRGEEFGVYGAEQFPLKRKAAGQ